MTMPARPARSDIPLSAAGTVAKLIEEGYTGYLVRATNDDMGDAPGLGTPGSIGQHVLGNERDNAEVARALGCKGNFDLNYNNHRMADVSLNEVIGRLIFLIRALKADPDFKPKQLSKGELPFLGVLFKKSQDYERAAHIVSYRKNF